MFYKIKDCRHGKILFNPNDLYVGRSCELYGEYCQAEIELFETFLTAGNIVIDIGANIGTHTIYFSKKAGSKGRVYAFEPQRLIYQMLCGNIAMNSLVNVYCYNEAVGKNRDTIQVPQLAPWIEYNYGSLSLEGISVGDQIRLIRLDDLSIKPDFIKIDVEGMEEDVLKGADSLISKYKPVLYIENDRPEKADSLVRYIDSLGYAMYWHYAPYFNPDNYFEHSDDIFKGDFSINMVCVPSESVVEEKFKKHLKEQINCETSISDYLINVLDVYKHRHKRKMVLL